MNKMFSISIEDNKHKADMRSQIQMRQYDEECVLRLM